MVRGAKNAKEKATVAAQSKSEETTSAPILANPSQVNEWHLVETLKPLIGASIPPIFKSTPNTDIYQSSLDDLDENFDENGKRKVPRIKKKSTYLSYLFGKDKPKTKQSKKDHPEEKSKWSSYCTFPVVALSILVGMVLFLIFMKLNEERFFLTQRYEEFDYYNALDLKKSATLKDIKRQFRKLALKYHPDRNPNCKDCQKKMNDINEAVIVLSHPGMPHIFCFFFHIHNQSNHHHPKNPETRAFHDRTGTRVPNNLLQKAKANKQN